MTALPTRSTLTINGDRLNASIARLAQIGRIPGGGVRRLAYSCEDVQARSLVQTWMQTSGLEVQIDPAGNLIGKLPGKTSQAPALATGSHLDTVPTGGRYDGAYGVLAGIEVVRVLQEHQIRLNHALEVIIFTDEEGTMLGSKAISGSLINDSSYYRRPDGTEIHTCLQRIGGDWERIQQARRSADELTAFVELHIEQGPVLEAMGKQIGVVEGIVAQRRFTITVTGRANHAGSTPMSMRQDALVAAAQVVLAVHQIGTAPGEQVATVGQVNVFPNAANVIPGRVEMSLDLRDLSDTHLDRLLAQLEQQIAAIARATQTQIELHPILHNQPALAAPQVQQAIAQACQQLGLSYMHLPSRAGHDAQELAKVANMGMIFVPSQAGISHAVSEYTSPEQCIQGANVLLQALLQLD